MSLSNDRNTPQREGRIVVLSMAAEALIYAGAKVALNASGYAVPGYAATGLKPIGRAEEQVDNTLGANGALTVKVRMGCFRYKNSETHAVTVANIGHLGYMEDDETVSGTDASGTLSAAGVIVDVDSDGVWVDETLTPLAEILTAITAIAANAANIAIIDDVINLTTKAINPATLADSAAPNNSIYYSSTQSALCYKDASGVVKTIDLSAIA